MARPADAAPAVRIRQRPRNTRSGSPQTRRLEPNRTCAATMTPE